MEILQMLSNPIACIAFIIASISIIGSLVSMAGRFKSSIKITTKGIEISPSVKFNTGTPYNTLVSITSWIEKETTLLIDNIHGIKRRYFKQSKDFAKSSLVDIREKMAQMYAEKYDELYNKTNSNRGCVLSSDLDSPDSNLNNSFYFFRKCLYADFQRKIETPIYILIEENHLINRKEREYEEEIINLSTSITSELKTVMYNYPAPIEHKIVMEVYNSFLPDLKNTITNSLRNSRTISMDKREVITEEKLKYIAKKTETITNLVCVKNAVENDKEGLIGKERVLNNYN